MKGTFHRIIVPMILILLLISLFAAICLVNFSKMPGFYNADMYLDLLYASAAWEHKSVFPEGWVFGNQFYVVSTPVIAALLHSVLNPLDAMAMASTTVSAALILSFLWMVKPAVRSREARLAGVAFFVAMVLYCGDATAGDNGWQLLFTMCSYYGIYAVTAFLAFGCYLRTDRKWSPATVALFAVTCVLSFGTGMQSLRQTAVMTCPLIGMEVLRLLDGMARKRKPAMRPMIVAGVLSGFNIAGLVVIRLLEIPHRQMNMNAEFWGISGMLEAVPDSLLSVYSIFGIGGKTMLLLFGAMVIVCAATAARMVWCAVRRQGREELQLLMLFALGLAAVFGVSVLGILKVRPIYYFMLYPMVSFLMAYCYEDFGKIGKCLVWLFLTAMICLSWQEFREEVLEPVAAGEGAICEVSEYLTDNGYTTLYTEWDNAGEDVAVASGGSIRVGYWSWEYAPFESIRYLCDPGIYDEDPARCVYLFRGDDRAELGCEAARQTGTELTLLRHFEESDLYLYTAPINLMR